MRKKKGVLTYILVGLLTLGLLWPGQAILAEPGSDTPSPASTSLFSDVNPDNGNLVYINYINARGIMGGFTDGSFRPDEGLTRAQAAVIISKAAQLSTGNTEASIFNDVSPEHWAFNYINTAVQAGYLQGFGDGSYQPEQPLTRAQAISLLFRLSSEKDSGVPLPALNDMPFDHWAAREMAMAIDAGMISLKDSTINPDHDITRGDMSRALAVLLTSDPGLATRQLYGILKITKGEVKLSRSGQAAVTVSASQQIGTGDTIETLAGASAQIDYPDGSSLLLEPGSIITIKESIGRAYIKHNGQPGTAVDNLQIELPIGTLFGALSELAVVTAEDEAADPTVTAWKKTSRLLAANTDRYDLLAAEEVPWYNTAETKKVKVTVDMPWGVAAIRGTFWQNTVDNNGNSGMSVLQGQALLTSGGQSVTVGSGQATSGIFGAPPSPPAPMPPAQLGQWARQQNWVQNTFNNMSQNQGSPPPGALPGAPTPSNAANLLNQALNQALQQAQQQALNNPPPASSSSEGNSSNEPTTPASEPLNANFIDINHINVAEESQDIIWVIAVGGLQVGDIVKVYKNSTDTTGLFTSTLVPNGDDRLIFSIAELETKEGSLWLTRTSTNKQESNRTVLPFKVFAEQAPELNPLHMEISNNLAANDEVIVGNLDPNDRIIVIVYIEEEVYYYLSNLAGEDGTAVISGLNLLESGGYIGISRSRPGTYLSQIVQKDYMPEEGENVLTGIPDRIILLGQNPTSFKLEGFIEPPLIDNSSDKFNVYWDTSLSEIIISMNDYGQGSFILQVANQNNEVLNKEIDVYVLYQIQLKDEYSQVLLIEEDYTSLNLRISSFYEELPEKIELIDYSSFNDFSTYITDLTLVDETVTFKLESDLAAGHYLLMIYNQGQPVAGAPFYVIGESAAQIYYPENDTKIKELQEIKFSSSAELADDKAKVAIIGNSDGSYGFLQQYEQEWSFSSEEYWIDLQCTKTAEDEWSIEFDLPMDRFYTDHEYIILLKVNTDVGVVLSASRFIYDNEAPELAPAHPFAPFAGETDVLSSITLEMYFIEQVEKVAGKYIKIWEDNESVSEPFAVIDAENVVIEDNFGQDSTVTFTLPQALESQKAYYIEVDPGAFIDKAGNEYEGISGKDIWYFTSIGY